jgi:hypothetical protein
MEGLADLWGAFMALLPWVLAAAAVHHAGVLALAVRLAPEGKRLTEIYGDPAEVRTLLLPVIVLTGLVAAVWPWGAFVVSIGLSEALLAWQHGGQKERKAPLVPSEGNPGLAVYRLLVWLALGTAPWLAPGGLGATAPGLFYVALPMAALAFGIWRLSTGQPPILLHVTALTYGVWGGEMEEPKPVRKRAAPKVARRQVADEEVEAAAAAAAVPVDPEVAAEARRASEEERRAEARAEAQRLVQGALAVELRAIRAEEEEARAAAAERAEEERIEREAEERRVREETERKAREEKERRAREEKEKKAQVMAVEAVASVATGAEVVEAPATAVPAEAVAAVVESPAEPVVVEASPAEAVPVEVPGSPVASMEATVVVVVDDVTEEVAALAEEASEELAPAEVAPAPEVLDPEVARVREAARKLAEAAMAADLKALGETSGEG